MSSESPLRMPASQLLINYTNEVLQNIFNEMIFHAAQARCERDRGELRL